MKGPKGPTKEQLRLQKMQEEELREADSEIAERKAGAKRRARGRGALLTGSETGQRETLG